MLVSINFAQCIQGRIGGNGQEDYVAAILYWKEAYLLSMCGDVSNHDSQQLPDFCSFLKKFFF